MNDVLKRISYAQIASDGGKRIKDLKDFNPKVWHSGYCAKDREILRAISMIHIGKGHGVSYYVKKAYVTDRGKQCYLVLFNFKLEGKPRQVSFHSFNDKLNEYIVENDPHATRWKKHLVDSRSTVYEMLRKEVKP